MVARNMDTMADKQPTCKLPDDYVAEFWQDKLKNINRTTIVELDGQDTIVKIWQKRVKISEHKVAFECLGKKLTFGEIEDLSNQVANYLLGRNFLQKGDCVGIMLPNIAQYIVIVLGILKSGYTIVNCNPLYTSKELEDQLKDSEVKLLFTIPNDVGSQGAPTKFVQATEMAKISTIINNAIGPIAIICVHS